MGGLFKDNTNDAQKKKKLSSSRVVYSTPPSTYDMLLVRLEEHICGLFKDICKSMRLKRL